MSEVELLTKRLVDNGATRPKVVSIIDGYGDAIDWSGYTLTDIIGEVWNSDANSGDEPEHYIVNEICRQFNVEEVRG